MKHIHATLRVNAERLRANFDALAYIGATPEGGVHRPALSESHLAARTWFLDQARKHKVTVFNSLGAIGQFIYNQPKRPDDGDNPIRVCAAFPMPAEIYSGFENRYNLKVVEGYGLTELVSKSGSSTKTISQCLPVPSERSSHGAGYHGPRR